MKWMIASDIHGSAFYCQKLLNAYKEEGAQSLILLGDILYHGPRNDLPREYNPKKVIEILNEYKQDILCVRGNCDTEVDQMVLDFPILADYCLLVDGNCVLFCTHGHLYNPNNVPFLHKKNILLCGHTHVPSYKEYEEYVYINPGSVSIPKENSWHGYVLYENGIFTWKDLEGNIKIVREI